MLFQQLIDLSEKPHLND